MSGKPPRDSLKTCPGRVLHTCFAINNAPSALGCHLSPFFVDWGTHPRLQLSLPNLSEAQETPEAYSCWVKLLEEEV